MKWSSAGIALLVLAAAASSAAQPVPGAEAVAPPDLRGFTLVVSRWNLRLPAPGAGWTWWRLRAASAGGESFVCVGPGGERFIATVVPNAAGRVNDEFIRGIEEGIERGSARTGIRYSGMRSERTDVPLPGSYRLSADATLPSGVTADWRESVSGSDPVYLLQAVLPRGGPPDEFDRFVAGLALIEPKSPPPAARTRGEPLLLGVIVVLVCTGLGGIVNRVAGRPLVNGALVGIVAAILFAVGFSAYIASFPEFGKLSPGKQGELIGGEFGSMLLGVAIGWYFSRKFKAKQAAYAAAKSGGRPIG